MTFTYPHRLWLLAVAGGLLGAYALAHVHRRRTSQPFASPALLAVVAPDRPGAWRHVIAAAFAVALAVATIGSAQPAIPGEREREHATVVVVIDVSDSMGATDVKPSRIAAAVAAAKTFVRDLPSNFDVGLVTAGASPAVMAEPTTDHRIVLAALDELELRPGTALGDAILTALATIPSPADERATDRGAHIVLLSDGVTTTGRPDAEAIAAAQDEGVPVSAIAFGTDDARVRSQGQVVEVPVDASALEAIAERTGGTFFEAASAAELRSIYDRIDTEVTIVEGDGDVTEWFAGAALVLFTLAVLVSLVTTSRAAWT